MKNGNIIKHTRIKYPHTPNKISYLKVSLVSLIFERKTNGKGGGRIILHSTITKK